MTKPDNPLRTLLKAIGRVREEVEQLARLHEQDVTTYVSLQVARLQEAQSNVEDAYMRLRRIYEEVKADGDECEDETGADDEGAR